ncbi:MAG: L-serine ammonia-lyase, iron-sulfur-dependent, subunit alpha [Cyclobacteriaceae bacterium]
MSLLFESFEQWKAYTQSNKLSLYEPVLIYEAEQKERNKETVLEGLGNAFDVMEQAVNSGLTEEMKSYSGMIDNGAKKVAQCEKVVLSKEFQQLISRALGAKEVNSCMGRVVAAPTAGASGILPGTLVTLKELHNLSKDEVVEGLLVAAGVALVLEKRASLAGAVGGCQAETGSAAAMAAAAIVHCLGGTVDQVFNAVAITIQCMLGLVCDPVAGLVEVPCVVRNASAAAIANSSAQIALSDVSSVIPVDECVDAMAEVGHSMESRYKETALGGLAATKTGKSIAKRVIGDIDIVE